MAERFISLKRDSSASFPPIGTATIYSELGVLKFWPEGGEAKAVYLNGDTYDGEPANYVAPIPAAPEPSSYAHASSGNDNNLTFTSVATGTAANDALMITLLGGADPDSPIDVYLDTENPGGGVTKVCVDLATDSGDNATGILVMADESESIFEADMAGLIGDEAAIILTLPMQSDPYGGDMVVPSVIAVSSTLDGSEVTTELATTSGVPGRVCVVESFSGVGGLTVQQTADYAGTWGNETVGIEIKIQPEASTGLAVTVLNDQGALTITVYLETDSEGIPTLNAAEDVVDAINAELAQQGLDIALVASDGCAQAIFFEADGTVGPAAAGDITVTIAGAEVVDSPAVVTVGLANGDTPEIWAGKVVAALNAETDVSTGYLAYQSGVNVYLVAKAVATNDVTLDMTVVDTDTTGITAVGASTVVNDGVDADSFAFNSAASIVMMGVGGVPAVDPVGDNAVNLAEDIEDSIDVAGDGILSLATASSGTYFSTEGLDRSWPSISIPFTGGGGNAAIISTAEEVIDAIAAFAPAAALMVATLTGSDGGAGTGAGVVEVLAESALVGGKDIGDDTPEVLGTPGQLGRKAIGFATGESTVKSEWTAHKDDNTTTQDGWVKTFTGS